MTQNPQVTAYNKPRPGSDTQQADACWADRSEPTEPYENTDKSKSGNKNPGECCTQASGTYCADNNRVGFCCQPELQRGPSANSVHGDTPYGQLHHVSLLREG